MTKQEIEEIEKIALQLYPQRTEFDEETWLLRGAFVKGAEWMHEHNKYLDVHTDNSEVIANMQAEMERLKERKRR